VPEWVLPPKEEVYSAMEPLIWHFKIVMGETEVPVGEVYHCVEGGNGELGFYLVSDGGKHPVPPALAPAVLHLLSGLPRNDQRQHVERCDPHHEQHERDRWRTGRMMRRTRPITTTEGTRPFAFSEAALAECRALMARYPEGRSKSALIPILHIAQARTTAGSA
jgi:hypothetical protein